MDFRELLIGVKQWKPDFELPSEQLPKIFLILAGQKVDADGILPLS